MLRTVIDPVPRALQAIWPVEGRTGTVLPGWKGVLIGLPFVGVGLLLALVVAPRRSGHDAPVEVIAAFGAVFFAAGAMLIVAAARPLWRARRRARLLALHRAEPWRADFAWDRRGIAGDAGRQAGAAFVAFAGIGAFLAVFGYAAFGYLDAVRDGGGVWLMRGGVAFFGLLLAVVLANALRLLAGRLKYGRGFLHFGRFPFLLGERADLRLAPPRHARGLRSLRVTLRCVEERIEDVKQGAERHISVVRWQLWADSRTVPATELAAGGLSLSYELPPDPALGTDLSATPPRYWELSADADAPGVEYAATFLVPVYASPLSTARP